MSRQIVNILEAFETRFNPSKTKKGLRIAHRETAKALCEAIQDGKLPWGKISFKDMYEAMVRDRELEENLDSSGFPTITGALISKRLIDGYNNFPAEEMKLVTVEPTSMRDPKIVGWTSIGTLFETKEREDIKEIVPPDEKFVGVTLKKRAGLISVTREVIKFDQTGQLLSMATMVGQRAAQDRQKLICKGVIDVDANVYNKGSLYASPSSTGGTYGNAYTGADTALGTPGWENTDSFLREKTDETGEPIWVLGDMPILMCTPRKGKLARKLLTSEHGPVGTNNLEPNLAKGGFTIFENPYIPSLTTSTKWYYGAFARQFRWLEVWPLEVLTRSTADGEDAFKRDILFQVKADYFAGLGAADTKYVIYNAGA